MKSSINPNHYVIECICTDDRHLLFFDIQEQTYVPPNQDQEVVYAREVHISIHTPRSLPLWLRLKFALKYIFKLDGLSITETVLIDNESIAQLEEVINALKKPLNSDT